MGTSSHSGEEGITLGYILVRAFLALMVGVAGFAIYSVAINLEQTLALFSLELTDFYMICLGIVLFTLYWVFSEKLLFGPLLTLFEEREAATAGAKDAAASVDDEARKLRAVYDETIANARSEGVREKMSKVALANKEANEITAQAETQAKDDIEANRKALKGLEDNLRSELSSQSDQLASQLAEQILSTRSGGALGSSSAGVITVSGLVASLLASLILFFVFLTSSAYAGGKGHIPSFSDTFIYWPNFLVFCGFMFWLLRKPFIVFWKDRAVGIENAINAGEIAKKKAQENLEAIQKQIANVDIEVRELRERMVKESDFESERIVSDASQKAQSITQRAQETKASERNSLEFALREELAGTVIDRAKKILQSEVSAEKDVQLRKKIVEGAGALLGR